MIIDRLRRLIDSFQKNPKNAFYVMAAIMILSFVWNIAHYALPQKKEQLPPPEHSYKNQSLIGGFSNEISNLTNTSAEIFSSMQIKKEIDALLNKDSLSREDSLTLMKAIERMEKLDTSLNPN